MKIKNIFKIGMLAAASSFMVACEDEVLVEKQDTTQADALIAEINDVENQLLTLSLENSELTIENQKLDNFLDSLWNVRNQLTGGYSQPASVDYTVNVLSTANTIFSGGRSKGLENATVVVEQNGLVIQPSSNGAGLYAFRGLTEGNAYVRVSAPNHASVEMSIYLYINDGSDVDGAKTFNAASQVVLYPVAGDMAATIKGMVYANRSTLNDTIGRKFGSDAVFAAKANTYIAAPGVWNYGNYTQDDDYWAASAIYGYPSGNQVAFEAGFEGHKIYAVPSLSNLALNNDNSNSGYIISITYKGLITNTEINADGSYELKIPAGSDYGNGLFNSIELRTSEVVSAHTRLTVSDGNYEGEYDESGSVETTFTYFNNSNGTVTPFDGDGVNTVSLDAGEKAQIKRRTITENWIYYPYFTDQNSMNDNTLDNFPESGKVINRNIYFFPEERD